MKLLLAPLLLALTACTQATAPSAVSSTSNTRADSDWVKVGGQTYVKKMEYLDDGVTCYVYDGYRSGGISCLPTKQGEQQ